MEEQVMEMPRSGRWKWILGILLALVILAGAGMYFLFYINQFSLSVALEGEAHIILEYGEEYEEPGAFAIFRGTHILKEGITPEDITVQISGELDAQKLGRYTLTYSAEFEWLTASCQRTIRVVDTQCPVITLVSENEEPLLAGTAYEEEGFTAVDNYDGDITDRVHREELFGAIRYTVYDSSGNPASVEREIPYYDPLPPEIKLEGGAHYILPTGTVYREPGFQALDNVDGDLTEMVSVEGEVDCYHPGVYPITYTVTDGFENTTTVTRNVEITAAPRPEQKLPNGNVIYLTFDDGPGPYTEALLEVLEKYGVKATFFVTDSGYDSLMKKIVDQGHSIGIHTVTHSYNEIYASPEAYFSDLLTMQEIIYKNTGVKTTLMRFPGGGSNLISRRFWPGLMTLLTQAVQDAGFQYFDWNVDSDDAGNARDADTVYENVTRGVQAHRVSIVLQHDIHPYSVEAVEDILRWGLDNGYQFLPLEQTSPGFHHEVGN